MAAAPLKGLVVEQPHVAALDVLAVVGVGAHVCGEEREDTLALDVAQATRLLAQRHWLGLGRGLGLGLRLG